ncbi:MAG TPA: response regulator [Geobacteraceae bacterium]|nr:response regulator [Geobacteraceae bacterium]
MNKPAVLIVEDEAIIAADLAGKLAILGYEIAGTAASGEEAVELARSLRPQVVLMDMWLKGEMDGIEAAAAIRRLDIPVIYVTGHAGLATLERAKLTGSFGYILKPFDERYLAATIELALHKHRADLQLRDSEAKLAKELEDSKQLQAISCQLIQEEKVELLYQRILDAAISFTGSDMGSMQMLDPERRELDLLTWKGFHPESAAYWQRIAMEDDTTCGAALRAGQRLIVPDVRTCEFLKGSPSLRHYELCGITAIQSTPLMSRDGRLLGMISTHWRECREPREQELRMLDVLARQAADLLERKRAEDSLRRANEELEAKVAERTKELREKDQMLISQSRQAAMGEMLGNIAHQWRQPLNSVGMIMQTLTMMYDAGELNRENLVAMEKQVMELVRYMSRTIDDFRNFFRTDREKVPFQVRQAVEKSVSLVEASFKNHFITTEINLVDDPVITGFQSEYSQVLLNIMQNARDAFVLRQVGEAKVTIAVRKEDGRSVVTITDNAGGIADDIMPKIFDPYFSTKGPEQGTGVGLFMSKAIIEKNMGGRLTVRNTGDGAEFRIEV